MRTFCAFHLSCLMDDCTVLSNFVKAPGIVHLTRYLLEYLEVIVMIGYTI